MNSVTYRSADGVIDAMNRVYFQMMLAVLTSMVVAGVISSTPVLLNFFFTGIMKWITIFAPLVFVFLIPVAMAKAQDKGMAMVLLHVFAALMGLSMGAIFSVFTIGSIVSAFMGAVILFGTLSLYGYFTKRDLQSFGQFLFVGLIAIVIASIVNVFIGNSLAASVISALAILVFAGLTAYDTQRIRQEVSVENNGVSEIMGALTLYLNFVNIFTSLLQLFGIKDD
jgi:FtsH-binding integral membrane protein